MIVLVRALLAAHLVFAFLATATFWVPAVTFKGGRVHRAAGRWFARLIYGAAATGGTLAVVGLVDPSLMFPARTGGATLASTRQVMWLILYFLVIIVAPVQHGLAVVAAGPAPLRVRSRAHAVLCVAAITGTLLVFPASLAWQAWAFLIAAPAGFLIGLRNMLYANRPSATAQDWRREHLTSLITAGITLHTAFFVLSALRWPAMVGGGAWPLVPWLAPGLVGLSLIGWLRRQ